MKKLLIILLILPLLGLISCVKQKNCEEGQIGTFQYLEEPFYFQPNCYRKEKKVVAVFYIDDSYKSEVPIVGEIPSKYKSGDLIKVRASIKSVPYENSGRGYQVWIACPTVCKLTCIEKED